MNYEEFLIEKYNKVTLSPKEVASELNITERMIMNRVRACSAEIPPFIKVGMKTTFPIKGVAKFLETHLVKVA